MKILTIMGKLQEEVEYRRPCWSPPLTVRHLRGRNELVHLYDLAYTGCTCSCFACKLKEGKGYGKCALRTRSPPALELRASMRSSSARQKCAIGTVTGVMRSFMERLMFPYLMYTSPPPGSLFDRKMPTAFVYTMNVSEQQMKEPPIPCAYRSERTCVPDSLVMRSRSSRSRRSSSGLRQGGLQ